jgi:hypothetical protein
MDIIKYYQKGVYPKHDKIVVIGDIHGDFGAFIRALKKDKIIDNRNNWCGGKKHVVQLGDVLDRKCRDDDYNDEDSELKIIALILKLQKQSFIKGGGFHCIIGNHEIMNTQGIFSYVSPLGYKSFNNNSKNRHNYFKPGSTFAKYLSDTWNPVIIIGNNLFCHGGISGQIAYKYTVNEINNIMRNYLRSGKINKQFNELFMHENSILWNRDYYSFDLNHELNFVLKKYNCERMLVGHTQQRNGITPKYNNKLWFVDVGMSEAFGKKENKNERIEIMVIEKNGQNIEIK